MTQYQSLRLLTEVELNNIKGVKKALQRNADVNHIHDTPGRSDFALKLAAASDKYYAMTKLLLEQANVDVNLVDGKKNSALMVACKNGSVKIASLLLDRGARVDLRDSDGNTALMSLCADTQMPKPTFIKLATLLQKHGASVNSVNWESGLSPLMVACTKRNYSAAEFLVQHGVDVNYRDSTGQSVLMMACQYGRIKFVELLLKSLVDVNLQNYDGTTALMIACKYGQLGIVELLKGLAKLDMQDKNEKTALMLACANGEVEIASSLLAEGARVDLQDFMNRTVLMNLCANRLLSRSKFLILAEVLLKYGASVDDQNHFGTSALMITCENDNYLATEFLIQHGALVNHQDKNGDSALMVAGMETTKLLLENKKVYVNLRNNKGITAFMKAGYLGQMERAQLLMNSGANVNVRDSRGRTLLLGACFKKIRGCVHFLISKSENCDIDIQDDEGISALMKACENSGHGWLDIAEELINEGADVNLRDSKGKTALMRACEQNLGRRCIGLLLKRGANVNLQDKTGQSALMMACRTTFDSYFMVQILLDYKAQFDLRDKLGQSALMIACGNGVYEVTKTLLGAGAPINTQDNAGQSALMIACRRSVLEIVRLLVSSGADIDQQDSTGQSALMIAACTSREDSPAITQLLLENGADVDLKDRSGMTALNHVIKAQNSEFVMQQDYTMDSEKFLGAVADLLIKQHGINLRSQRSQGQWLPSFRPEASPPLVVASENGDKDAVELSLDDGAEIDSRDSKGRTALIAASENGHSAIADLLIKGGACVDLQDNEGRSALMAACRNRHIQVASDLLEEGADTFLKDSKGMTSFNIAVEKNDSNILRLFAKLRSNPNYPGIAFLEGAKRETVVTEEKMINLEEVGISLSIPNNALSSTDLPLVLEIRPCFCGPFEAPQGVELVSPAYIVKPSRKVSFKKEVLVKIWHHANLESEEDCEDMVFLSASTTPEYRGDSPVYIFREIRGAKRLFRPGEEQPVGEIALKHFCTLALGKRKREGDETESEESVSKRNKGNLYSARLYRAIEKKLVFCICLYQPQYIKNCNEVIAAKYGMPGKKIDPDECFNGVRITSSEVQLHQTCDNGWIAMFKKRPASILKEEINTQELYDISDLLEMDYPPKIEIVIQSVPSSPDAGPLCLHVEGLDRDSTFILHSSDILSYSREELGLSTLTMKCAMSDLWEELQEDNQSEHSIPVSTLLPTAAEMLVMMETIERLLQHSSHADSVMNFLIKLERKSEQLGEDIIQILHQLKLSYDMDVYVERVNTFAVQMKRVFMANMIHSHSPEWQGAVGLFVTNAVNLMTAIKDTLRAVKWALTLPNNSLTARPVANQLSPTQTCLSFNMVSSQQPQELPPKLTSARPLHPDPTLPPKPLPRCPRDPTEFHPKPLPRCPRAHTLPHQDPNPSQPTVDPTLPPEPPPRLQSLRPGSPLSPKPLPRCPRVLAQPRQDLQPPPLPPLPCLPSTKHLQPNLVTVTSTVPPKPIPRRPRAFTQPHQDLQPLPLALPYKPSLSPERSPINSPPFDLTLLPPKFTYSVPKPTQVPALKPCVPQSPLTTDHTAAVCRCLYSLRAKWKTIGTFLCVDHDSLEAIKAGNEQLDDRLMALIAVWLRRHTPPPTWQALADAVQYIDPEKAQLVQEMQLSLKSC